MSERIDNAIITATKLGREDRGIMTLMIYVKAGGYSCGIGGFALDEPGENDTRIYSSKGIEAVGRILDLVEVNNWEDLRGKYIRIAHNGSGSSVTKIGHILQDKWLDLRDVFEK